MAAQDQRGDAQALWRPVVGEAKYSNAAMVVHRPRSSRRRECQRPERKARAQGLNHAWRELLELVSLHTVLLGRGGVLT